MLTRRLTFVASLFALMPARVAVTGTDLASCPLDVRGDWHAPPNSAKAVITLMREVSLAGITLRSDRQPNAIWVQNNPSGLPSIWLHETPAQTAWIMTDVGELAWCQLAYQFGHELGHVLCNSWQLNAIGPPPSRWLEETLVDSFSLRGLGLLAEAWAETPPFPNNASYSDAIIDYRRVLLAKYERFAREQGTTDLKTWYDTDEAQLASEHGFGALEQAAVPVVLGLIEPEPVLIEDYGALNRWPERSQIPLPDYLRKWRNSCIEIGAPGRLPIVLADLLGIAS